jgi:hypothetical protein
MYGVLPGPLSPPPQWGHAYIVTNTWLGQQNIVYAGKISDNPQRGVLVLADRESVPLKLGEYLAQPGDGALRIVSAQGDVLTIVATSGTRYTFDVNKPGLVRQ